MSSLETQAFECLADVKNNIDNIAYKRLLSLFDDESFTQTNSFVTENGSQTRSAVVCGYGTIEGNVVYAFSQDNSIQSGAMTVKQAEKIKKMYDMAAKTGCPVVGIFDSKGAKIDKMNEALYAYGEMLLASNNLSGVVPQISLVLGTCAGSAAMVASSADIVIMNKDAEFFVNSSFVLKSKGEKTENCETIGSAETASKCGIAHIVTKTEDEAIENARKIITALPQNNISSVPFYEFNEPENTGDYLNSVALSSDDYSIEKVIGNIIDDESFIEIQENFAKGAVCGLSTIDGITTGIIANRKADNFGILTKDECSKIARFVRFCDSFSIGILTLVDTQGFACTTDYEASGSVKQASMLSHAYAEATTAKISIVIGEAIGAAFIALAGKGANSDLTFAWPNAVISSLNVPAAAAILYKDEFDKSKDLALNDAEKEEKYKREIASPFTMAENMLIDEVIEPSKTRYEIIKAFDALSGKRVSKLPKKHGNIQI